MVSSVHLSKESTQCARPRVYRSEVVSLKLPHDLAKVFQHNGWWPTTSEKIWDGFRARGIFQESFGMRPIPFGVILWEGIVELGIHVVEKVEVEGSTMVSSFGQRIKETRANAAFWTRTIQAYPCWQRKRSLWQGARSLRWQSKMVLNQGVHLEQKPVH